MEEEKQKKNISIDKRALDGKFPFISKPTFIGDYSVSREREITFGRSDAMSLYVPVMNKPVKFDLDIGYDTFEQKEGDELLNILLKWIEMMAPNGGRLRKILHEAEFVSWRGLLTRIAATPYENREGWRFRALRKCGVVFMCEEETDAKKKKNENMTVREKHMTYWGFKFEQYMTIADGQEEPDTSQRVTCREEYANVVRTDIEAKNGPNIQLLYSAEIDCLDREGQPVELKTHRGDLEAGFWNNKSLKWWIQSFLIAIPKIVVGHRDDQGTVYRVDEVSTSYLASRGKWSSAVCMRFLSNVLTEVRNMLSVDNTACVVEYNQQGYVTVKMTSPSTCKFLPDSFVEKFY